MIRPFLCAAALAGACLLAHADGHEPVHVSDVPHPAAVHVSGVPHPAAVHVSGVPYPVAVPVGDTPLLLNGAGTRYKVFVKVYTAALYLPRRAETAEAALATPGAKRLHLVMLRDIDADELGRLFVRALSRNVSSQEFVRLIPGTVRVGEMFAARGRLRDGESVWVDWVPAEGMVVSFNGRRVPDPIPEPAFYAAFLKIWLGPRPADPLLKDALLREPGSS